MTADRSHTLDHVVVVLFENRSLDNVLGRLYGPGDGKTFEGVIGRDLDGIPFPSGPNTGPTARKSRTRSQRTWIRPDPDSGEEYFHTNTQLLQRPRRPQSVQDRWTQRGPPWNAPLPGTTPTMDGFVTDYISTFTGEIDRPSLHTTSTPTS